MRIAPPRFGVALALGAVLLVSAANAAESSKEQVDFARDVFPVLMRRCADCHGPDEQEGQFRIDARAAVFGGGVSGPGIHQGNAEKSILYQRIAGLGDEDRMPLDEDPLSEEQIALVRKWIEQGAQWPDGVGEDIAIKQHWAYEKPARPDLPQVRNEEWTQNAIDYFVLAKTGGRGVASLGPRRQSQALAPCLPRSDRHPAKCRGT